MLKPLQVEQIERLVAQGMAQRAIARRLRLSQGMVAAVAHGRHPLQCGRPPAGKDQGKPRHMARCPGCGRLVELPCRACRLKKRRRVEGQAVRRALHQLGENVRLGLELEGDDYRRYLQVRRRRRKLEFRHGNRAERMDVARAPHGSKRH